MCEGRNRKGRVDKVMAATIEKEIEDAIIEANKQPTLYSEWNLYNHSLENRWSTRNGRRFEGKK